MAYLQNKDNCADVVNIKISKFGGLTKVNNTEMTYSCTYISRVCQMDNQSEEKESATSYAKFDYFKRNVAFYEFAKKFIKIYEE